MLKRKMNPIKTLRFFLLYFDDSMSTVNYLFVYMNFYTDEVKFPCKKGKTHVNIDNYSHRFLKKKVSPVTKVY